MLPYPREVFAEAAERPNDFSELQMASYLKASQFRRQVDKLTAQAAAEAGQAHGAVGAWPVVESNFLRCVRCLKLSTAVSKTCCMIVLRICMVGKIN